MVELTIRTGFNSWWVVPKHYTGNYLINPVIRCYSSEEAMSIFQELNGSKLETIEAFIKLRRKLQNGN